MQNGMLNQRKPGVAPPTKEPAKRLSPAELADELVDLARDAVPWALGNELTKAKEVFERVQAKVDRAGDKKLRILRAKSIEEAKAILAENPADANLKLLCQKRAGWKPLQEKGATDQQLKQFLDKRANGWGQFRPYPHKMPSAQVDYSGACVWVDPDKGPDGIAHLSGQKLIDAVRRVMGIKKPAAPGPSVSKKKPAPPHKPTPKPTPAKKPAAKPKAPPAAPAKKPAPPPDENGDDDLGDSEEFDGDDGAEASAAKAAARLIELDRAWDEGPDATQDRAAFDVGLVRSQSALTVLLKFASGAATSERAFAGAAAGGRAFIHKTPWYQALGVTDQTRIDAMLDTQGNGAIFHAMIRDGATDAQIREGLGRALGISGGGSGQGGMSYSIKGGKAPEIKVGSRTYKGLELIEKVRDLLGIPAKRGTAAPQTMPLAEISSLHAPPNKKAGGLSDVETIPITAPAGATIEVSVGKVSSGEHRWRAGCRVVLHRLSNRALDVPLAAKGEARSSRAFAVRGMLQEHVRPFLEKLAKDGRESTKSRDFNDGEHKFVQDAISAVILFLHTNVEADTGGVLPPDASTPASGAKPKHPSIVAHNAVLARGGTFEHAAIAGTLADLKGPDVKCRVCGCTEDDCEQCIKATGAPCRWVEDPIVKGNLCSACKPREYGRKVSGVLVGGRAHAVELVIVGQGVRDNEKAYQVIGFGGSFMWVRKAESKIAPAEIVEDDGGQDGKYGPPLDDPNVDGRGVFVSGVEHVWVRGQAMNDKAKIVIRVARGADGRYRTGYLLEFKGAQAWNADGDEPVRISGQAVESEAYAVKARANILINIIKAAPGEKGGSWSPAQKKAYGEAIKQLQSFIEHNPACKEPKTAKAGAA